MRHQEPLYVIKRHMALTAFLVTSSVLGLQHAPAPLHLALSRPAISFSRRVAAPVRSVALDSSLELGGPVKVLYDSLCMVSMLLPPRRCCFRLPLPPASPCRTAVPPPPLATLTSHVCYASQVCLTNKAVLSFFDRRGSKINFVDIRDESYSPAEHSNIQYADAMRHFHVIDGQGAISEGSEAVLTAYSKVGLGWMMAVLRFPLIRWFIDLLYAFVSKHRYTISKLLPGGKALASAVSSLNDLETAAMGGGCDDEEECMLDYDDEEEEA